ncbi:hypothetical protein HAX54_010109, partial [Datura stramonium]|nr:hypothetical protein [Datura stramonium]
MDTYVRSVRNQNVHLTPKMALEIERGGLRGAFVLGLLRFVGGRKTREWKEKRLFGGDGVMGVVFGREDGRRGGWCLLGLLLRLLPEKEKKGERREKKREKGRRVVGVSGCFRVVFGWRSEAKA